MSDRIPSRALLVAMCKLGITDDPSKLSDLYDGLSEEESLLIKCLLHFQDETSTQSRAVLGTLASGEGAVATIAESVLRQFPEK